MAEILELKGVSGLRLKIWMSMMHRKYLRYENGYNTKGESKGKGSLEGKYI